LKVKEGRNRPKPTTMSGKEEATGRELFSQNQALKFAHPKVLAEKKNLMHILILSFFTRTFCAMFFNYFYQFLAKQIHGIAGCSPVNMHMLSTSNVQK
jgi:hypothetical protein